MAVVTIDEKEFEVADEVAAEMARLQESNTDQEGEKEEEEEEQVDSDTPEPAADAEGGGTPAPAPAGSPQAAPPQTSGTPGALSTTTVSVTSGKTDGFGKLLARLDGLEDRVASKLESKAKARADAATKAKRASEQAYADARGALPQSYNADGKSATTIMRDAIVARSPDLKAKADAAMKQPARLRGMFDAEMARAPQAETHPLGDVVPETSEKRDAWQKRVDANRNARHTHRVLGNEAMRQTAVAGAN